MNINELDVLSSNKVKITPLNTKLHGVVNSNIGNSVNALLTYYQTFIAFIYLLFIFFFVYCHHVKYISVIVNYIHR